MMILSCMVGCGSAGKHNKGASAIESVRKETENIDNETGTSKEEKTEKLTETTVEETSQNIETTTPEETQESVQSIDEEQNADNRQEQVEQEFEQEPVQDVVEIVEETWDGSIPVPISHLANYDSLKKGCTDEEFAEAYQAAMELVTPVMEMDAVEQLVYIASTLRWMFDNGMTYSMSEEHYADPYGYFIKGVASCAGCARATGLCLNILGIPYEHVNENQWSHQWCRVNINGTYYICDAFGLYWGEELEPYKHPNVQS